MGVDIHIVTEIRTGNSWSAVHEIPQSLKVRNYPTFAVLGNVRDFLIEGFKLKGLPSSMAPNFLKVMNKYSLETRLCSHLTLKELTEGNYEEYYKVYSSRYGDIKKVDTALDKGIQELKAIAKNHEITDYSNIRIIYGFES